MPEVTMPDGTVVTLPDNPTPEQMAKLQSLTKQGAMDVITKGSGVKAPMPPLTPSQRTYRMVRPFVAPVVETAGMVGGALGGAGGGPAGAVAGGGLGYGMGKQLVKAGDYNLGGYAPPPFNEQLLDASKDVLEGAAMETAGPYINKAVGYTLGGLKDAGMMAGRALGGATKQLAERRAAKIAQEAAAQSPVGNLQDTISAILRRRAGQTGAQATVDLQNPTLQAMLERSGARNPGAMLQIENLQAKESGDALRSLAPWENQTQGRQATEMLQEILNKRTGPIRERAFEMSNMGQLVADLEKRSAELGTEATAQVAKVRHLMDLGRKAEAGAQLDLIMQGMPTAASKYTYKGELAGMADKWASKAAEDSLHLGADARTAQAGANALRAEGIAPLRTEPVVKQIRANLNNPRFAGNDLIEGAVTGLADDIAKWTNADGIIPAEALDAIRKNSVDAVIARLRPGADATTQRKLAAKVLSEIKPIIDDAIVSSGGAEYKDYLAQHASGMQDINKTKLAGKALELWRTNKQAFVDFVNGHSPEEVEKILGPGQYDIAKALTQRETGILQDEAAKATTNEQVKSQAARGQEALAQLMKRNIPSYKFPFLLNWKVSAANQLIGRAEKGLGQNVMDQLSEAATDPEKLKALLERIPPSYRSAFLNALKANNGGVGQIAPAVQSYAASGVQDDGRQ